MEGTNKYTPDSENKISETTDTITFSYCDHKGNPIFKTKEIFKNEKKVIFYPFSINNIDQSIRPKRIKRLELVGWNYDQIPLDFKTDGKYGLRTQRAKSFFSLLYHKYKSITTFTIGINIANSFKTDHISLNWADLNSIFNEIYREKKIYDRERVFLINKELSKINPTIIHKTRQLGAGDLNRYLSKYDSFDKVTTQDLSALSGVLDLVPPSVIKTTSNFLKSKEHINVVYLQDIMKQFEALMSSAKDNEKQWQSFFEKNSWILSHLFPFEVILRQREAYLGGKTFENKDGRVVDFLFENGFKDNFALLEVKTHKKELLKKRPYRSPDVFVMSDDLSGGLNQCLDQKDSFSRDYGQKFQSLDPKTILIIGQKSLLSDEQKKCFELLRASQKHTEIVYPPDQLQV